MLQYSPKIVQDGLVMCLDPSQNKSYPTTDLPVKNGLVMWMDAADDTTFSYSSGTTVSQWRDKSGFNYHMVPKSSGPTRNAFLNSRKVLAFTTSQTIGNDTINLASSANTVFVVSRLTGTTNGRVLTCNLDSSGNNWLLGHHGGTYNDYYAEGWVTDGGSLDTNWRMYMGDWSGTSTDLANFYSNGTAITTNSTAASQGPNKLGVNYFSSELSTCEVAEIVVFNRVLSTAERRLVHTYLGQKWGISNTDRSIIDLSGNNNNGLLGDGVTADMPLFDVYNKGALKLDGSTDYVAVANATSLNPATVTVSIWVKRNGYQSQTANYLRRNYNDAYAILSSPTDDSALRFRIHNGSTYPESPTTTLALNEWTNIVGTYDLANIKIYKNGVFIGQTAHTSAISYASANTTLTIGRDDPVAGRYMNANYGSVLIYSRALSAAEIAQNYEAQKSKFANAIVQQGLVLNLDVGNPYSYAGAGSDWYDVSGNNNTSLLVGTTIPTFSNTNGGILMYDGNTQYSRTPSPSNNFAWTPSGVGLNNMTIDMWIKTTDGSGTILSKPWSGNGEYNFGLGHQGFSIVIGNQTNTLGFSSILTGNWINLVIVVSPTQYGAYINGVQNAALTNHGITNNTPTYGNGQVPLTLMTLYPYGGGGNAGFSTQGNIGSFRIYNRVLSAAEVLQNYNATKGRFGL